MPALPTVIDDTTGGAFISMKGCLVAIVVLALLAGATIAWAYWYTHTPI